MHTDNATEGDAAEPVFFESTPGPGDSEGGDVYPPAGVLDVHGFAFGDLAGRLGPGDYEIVYETARLQVGVYVLAAPEPDGQKPHEWDELYFVLEGRGTLTVEGEELPLDKGGAAFVAAHAHHHFDGYERLVLLVVFDKS